VRQQGSEGDLSSLDGSVASFDPESQHAINARRPLLPR
jgi:hypothetical protein